MDGVSDGVYVISGPVEDAKLVGGGDVDAGGPGVPDAEDIGVLGDTELPVPVFGPGDGGLPMMDA